MWEIHKYLEIKLYTTYVVSRLRKKYKENQKTGQLDGNENTIYQNQWDTQAGLRGKVIALNAYTSKEEKSQINI